MRNMSVVTGTFFPPQVNGYVAEEDVRLPYDPARARALLAEAGYPNGFSLTLDCPNNRYINDEEICIALASMWAQLKVKVKVNAMPRATYFPKIEKLDTSMYMLGWGGAITDAEITLTPVLRNRGDKGVGFYNYGSSRNDKFDALAAASSTEADPKKREDLVKAALQEYHDAVNTLPLHRQIARIRELGCKAGVTINPSTPVATLVDVAAEAADRDGCRRGGCVVLGWTWRRAIKRAGGAAGSRRGCAGPDCPGQIHAAARCGIWW